MSRTRISGWGLLLVLAALPAVLWMGSGSVPEEGSPTAGLTVSAAGFADAAEPGVDRPAGADRTAPRHARGSDDLALLRDRLVGSFSRAAQSEADSGGADARIHIVPVWPQRSDAHWLYLEQETPASLDRPHRMRVYRLAQLGSDLFESREYILPGEARFAGAWHRQFPLGSLTPDSLLPGAGRSIVLRRGADGAFVGSTLGHDREGDLRGAAYATSEVRIEADRLMRWGRGYDAAGTQVWGVEKGADEYRRIAE